MVDTVVRILEDGLEEAEPAAANQSLPPIPPNTWLARAPETTQHADADAGAGPFPFLSSELLQKSGAFPGLDTQNELPFCDRQLLERNGAFPAGDREEGNSRQKSSGDPVERSATPLYLRRASGGSQTQPNLSYASALRSQLPVTSSPSDTASLPSPPMAAQNTEPTRRSTVTNGEEAFPALGSNAKANAPGKNTKSKTKKNANAALRQEEKLQLQAQRKLQQGLGLHVGSVSSPSLSPDLEDTSSEASPVTERRSGKPEVLNKRAHKSSHVAAHGRGAHSTNNNNRSDAAGPSNRVESSNGPINGEAAATRTAAAAGATTPHSRSNSAGTDLLSLIGLGEQAGFPAVPLGGASVRSLLYEGGIEASVLERRAPPLSSSSSASALLTRSLLPDPGESDTPADRDSEPEPDPQRPLVTTTLLPPPSTDPVTPDLQQPDPLDLLRNLNVRASPGTEALYQYFQ